MKIIVVEPFYIDSHKAWLDGLIQHSSHHIEKLTLPGHHWKWRMHGAAVTLAKKYKTLHFEPDLILCTDMLDLAVFTSLLRNKIRHIPIGIYFHENQLSYPWSPNDLDVKLKRDRHYAFINYTSALTADFILFNSLYHKESFISSLGLFLHAFPDYKNLETINEISEKSDILGLGLNLSKFDPFIRSIQNKVPCILWNHRWEYDKNPETFFKVLKKCKDEGLLFNLIVLGKKYPSSPDIFKDAEQHFKANILHWGYAEDWETYARLVCQSDILLVTSNQDFFGISVVEAIYCGIRPILPRRLAYTEHVSEGDNFYESEETRFRKLKEMIIDHPSSSKIDLSKIRSYDWSRQILLYDDTFSKLSANFASN